MVPRLWSKYSKIINWNSYLWRSSKLPSNRSSTFSPIWSITYKRSLCLHLIPLLLMLIRLLLMKRKKVSFSTFMNYPAFRVVWSEEWSCCAMMIYQEKKLSGREYYYTLIALRLFWSWPFEVVFSMPDQIGLVWVLCTMFYSPLYSTTTYTIDSKLINWYLEHGGHNGPDCKITITQKINHDGEVNRYVFSYV